MTLSRRLAAINAALASLEVQVRERTPEELDAQVAFLTDFVHSGLHREDEDGFLPPPPGWTEWEHNYLSTCRRCVADAAARAQMLTIALASVAECYDRAVATVTIPAEEWRQRGRWWPEDDTWQDNSCTTLDLALDALHSPPWSSILGAR